MKATYDMSSGEPEWDDALEMGHPAGYAFPGEDVGLQLQSWVAEKRESDFPASLAFVDISSFLDHMA